MNYLIENRWTITLLVLGAFIFGIAYFNRVEAVNSVNFFWRAEGTTLDGTDDFSAGDITATIGGTAAINTDAAFIGTNGLDIPSSSDYALFSISSGDLLDVDTGAIALWFRLNVFGGATLFTATQIAQPSHNITIWPSGTDDATGREISFRIRRAGAINLTLTTTDADLALNTWYFLVARFDEPNNDRRIEIYNDDGSLRTAREDLDTNFDQPGTLDQMQIGDGSGGSGDLHLDNIFIADDYNEPLEDKMNITSWTEYEASAVTTPVTVRGGINVRSGVNLR